MIPRSLFEELRGKTIRIYVKDLPTPHSVHSGKIEAITEHIIILRDEDHNILIYIPIDQISLIKTT
ncbi:MAG: DUF6897 domain-containing protein [Candidatus Hodarchaeota archaeon]